MDRIESAINIEDENFILNIEDTSYIDHLCDQYSVKFPHVKFEEVYIDADETDKCSYRVLSE